MGKQIEHVKMTSLYCDGCGKRLEGNDYAVAWGREELMEEVMNEQQWIERDKHYYCEECKNKLK